MIRTDHHKKAEELAQHATVPVINGLTDLSHPCQLLADMQTVIEKRAKLAGSRWAWLGDGNNVCNSLIEAASLMHFELAVACPNQFEPDMVISSSAVARGGRINFTPDPKEAIGGAEVVVTDTWVSMGQEDDEYRQEAFASFQVDEEIDGACRAGRNVPPLPAGTSRRRGDRRGDRRAAVGGVGRGRESAPCAESAAALGHGQNRLGCDLARLCPFGR